jgi:hypothetical protein
VAIGPGPRGGHEALWKRPISWLWTRCAWVAGVIGLSLIAMTFYVRWASKDLPDPSQNVLTAEQADKAGTRPGGTGPGSRRRTSLKPTLSPSPTTPPRPSPA